MALNIENYAYPSEQVDPKKKNKDYIAQYGRAFYSEFLNQGGNRWYNGRTYYQELIDYAMGNQSIDRYKSRKGETKTRGYNFKEKNIDLSILPIVPDFVRKMQGRIAEAQYEATATAVDSNAQSEKEDYEFRLRAKMRHQDLAATIAPAGEMQGAEEIPLDDNELQLKITFGYKHNAEIAVEKALQNAFHQSDFEQIQAEVDFDAIVLGDYCSRDIVENGREKVEYCPPDEMFVPASRYEDYRDIRSIGRLRSLTISEIRQMSNGEISEADLEEIAKGYRGNNYWPNIDSRLGMGFAYDSQKIDVFFFEFLSYDELVMKNAKDQYGNSVMRERGYESKKKENIRKGYRCLYEGAVIPNSKFSFNCRRAFDQKRDPENMADCHLTYHPCSPGMRYSKTISLVKDIAPAADQAQRAWLRMNAAIAEAIPKGFAYDLDKLENIALGKNANGQSVNLSVGEIMELHQATGNFLYRGKDASGQEINGRAGITEMENGLPKDIQEYMGIIRNAVYLIQSITGQNPTALGQTNPDIGKGVSEMALNSADNSLYFLYRARKSFFGRNAKALAIRIYDRLEREGISGSFTKTVGDKKKADVVNISKEQGKKISTHRFIWNIGLKPTAQEWQEFYGAAKNALAQKEITYADYTLLVQTDNLKEAWAILSIREKRNRLQAMEKAQADIAANNEGAAAAAERAEAAKQATLQMEWDLKGKHELLKSAEARALQTERYAGEIELETLRGTVRKETVIQQGVDALAVKEAEGDNYLEQTALAASLDVNEPAQQNY